MVDDRSNHPPASASLHGSVKEMYQICFCLGLLLSLANPAEAATRSDAADELSLDTKPGISAPQDPFSDPIKPFQNPVQIGIERNPGTDNHPRGNPLWAVPLSVLSVTRERPIFSVSRRPPPQAVMALSAPEPVKLPPPQPAPPEVPRLVLVGAVGYGDAGIAIFVDQSTRGVIRLKIGDVHSGWELRQVRGRETTLQKDNRTVLLALPQPGDPHCGAKRRLWSRPLRRRFLEEFPDSRFLPRQVLE